MSEQTARCKYAVKCYTILVVEAESPEEAIEVFKKMPGLAVVATPLDKEKIID